MFVLIRRYYKCKHENIYACGAKKQVQQLGEHPDTFEVLYLGGHSCCISFTIPSTSPLDGSVSINFWEASNSNKLQPGEVEYRIN